MGLLQDPYLREVSLHFSFFGFSVIFFLTANLFPTPSNSSMTKVNVCNVLFTTVAMAITSCEAATYPVGISNCGVSNWIEASPERAVTMNQGATEVLLALGLEDRMAGTAYLDDEIWPEYAEAYNTVPVLNDTYPNIDKLMSVDPDFIYGSYGSAFANKPDGIYYSKVLGKNCSLAEGALEGDDTFCRKELHEYGIDTYLQVPYCESVLDRPQQTDMNTIFTEIWDMANIFGAHEEAKVLIDTIEGHLNDALEVAEFGRTLIDKPLRVLWLDSWDDAEPYVGSCCGPVQLILEAAGAENIFDELGLDELRSWTLTTWEDIEAQDPDLIVLVDASWDLADDKIHSLCHHPIASKLRAVKNRAYITVPFSASTLGVRIGALAYNLAEAFNALALDVPVSNLDFSEISITADGDVGGQGVAKSGVRVYTRLPLIKDVDLESFCPGESTVRIGESPRVTAQKEKLAKETADSSTKIPTWAIALIAVFGVVVAVAIVAVATLISREKSGTPMFAPETDPMVAPAATLKAAAAE